MRPGKAAEVAKVTEFAKDVYAKCKQIPAGRVTTYGALAAACGKPGAARAVGQIMRRNPFKNVP